MAVMEVSHTHLPRTTKAQIANIPLQKHKYSEGSKTQKTIQLNPLKKFDVSRGSIALFKKPKIISHIIV